MRIDVDKGSRVKVKNIDFEGNTHFADAKLRRVMKKTKQKNFLRVLKRSKYTEEGYNEDKESILKKNQIFFPKNKFSVSWNGMVFRKNKFSWLLFAFDFTL